MQIILVLSGRSRKHIQSILSFYSHIEYNDKTDPEDDLPDEDVTAIDEIPVYSINKPKPESLVVLKILDNMLCF